MREIIVDQEPGPDPPRLVFSDGTGRRNSIVLGLILLVAICVVGILGEFLFRISKFNTLPGFESPVASYVSLEEPQTLSPTSLELGTGGAVRCERDTWAAERAPTGISAFLKVDDRAALAALRQHCGSMDAVYYPAVKLMEEGTTQPVIAGDPFAFPLEEFRAPRRFRDRPEAWPLIVTEAGLHGESLVTRFSDGTTHAPIISQGQALAARAAGAAGLCLDLAQMPGVAKEAVLAGLGQLRTLLAPLGLQTCLVASASEEYLADAGVLALVDRVVALLRQNEHMPFHPPAPSAWVEERIAELKATVAPQKLHFALLTSGVAWRSGAAQTEDVNYPSAMLAARENAASLSFKPEDGALRLRFASPTRRRNLIWLPDAATLLEQMRHAGPEASIVLWPLGGEDPTLWQADLEWPSKRQLASATQDIDLGNFVSLLGHGPFSVLREASVTGRRLANVDPQDGALTDIRYASVPQPNRIDLIGATETPEVAITFDGIGRNDALDEVLASLAKHKRQATFFIDVADVLFREDQITRVIAQGHSIAILARVRPHLSHSKAFFLRIRSKLTQHALAHELGIIALMVREPAVASENIQAIAELQQLRESQAYGLLPIQNGLTAPLALHDREWFLERLRSAVVSANPHILRFDMSVENSRATAAIFDTLLGEILDDGIAVRDLPQMAGMERDTLQPANTTVPRPMDDYIYAALRISWISVEQFVFLIALIVSLRSPVYLAFALAWRDRYPKDPDFRPPVTVIVPAYNEGLVIERTIRSILATGYPGLSVMVVDDGSTDNTGALVRETFAGDDRVTLISQTNHGKWQAEDTALAYVETPIFIIIDADTLLHPEAIDYLVQPFKNAAVGAVAGTVEVGNPINFITLCQKLEYLISQSVMRRAYQVFDGILVVPGAIGAWRLDAVRKAGLVPGDTITEDADLTVAVHRANYKVIYQPKAMSYTEVPETATAFMKQRLRWSLGMLQVSWKHRASIAEGRGVGAISIVDAVWFRFSSSIVYPIVDALLVFLAADALFHLWIGEAPAVVEVSPSFFLALGLLTVADLGNVLAAFWFDRAVDWRLVLIVPLLRFGYRQLLYISSFRSILHALTGKMRGWQKLARTGGAQLPVARS